MSEKVIAWLSEPVATITYKEDTLATQPLLLAKLEVLGIRAEAKHWSHSAVHRGSVPHVVRQ